MHSDEEGFIRAIQAAPHDEELRLIYADWLEERDDIRGEFLRLSLALGREIVEQEQSPPPTQRLAELRTSIDPGWLAFVDRIRIAFCVQFTSRCSQQWQDLTWTDNPLVRCCWECGQEVHYCQSAKQARLCARSGHCVAADPSVDLDSEELRQQLPRVRVRVGLRPPRRVGIVQSRVLTDRFEPEENPAEGAEYRRKSEKRRARQKDLLDEDRPLR